MADLDSDAFWAHLSQAPASVIAKRKETPEARMARALHENDLDYLQAELVRLGYVDYCDTTRCMKRGCRARPAARASPCECRALCGTCLKLYQESALAVRCPVCLGRDTTFSCV